MKISYKIYITISVIFLIFIFLFIFIINSFSSFGDLKDFELRLIEIKIILNEQNNEINSSLIINALKNLKTTKGIKHIDNELREKIISLETTYKNSVSDTKIIINDIMSIINEIEPVINNSIKNRKIFISFFSIMLITLIFILLYFISLKLTSRIKIIEKAMHKVAEKDLSVRLDIKYNDEIDNLSRYINSVLSLIEDFFSKVKNATSLVTELKDILSSETVESASSLNEMSNNIASIKNEFFVLDNSIDSSDTSVKDINSKIINISESINNQANAISLTDMSLSEMSMLFKEVSDISLENKNKTEILIKNVLSGGEDIRRTNEIVKSISDQIYEISEIIKIINGIADKTNILSVNAAIESAHAGDKGKGFTLISEDIRRLAQSSSEQSNLISKILFDIIDRIKKAMSSSDKSYKSFNNINIEVESFVSALKEISDKMHMLTTKTNFITELTNNVSKMTEGVLTGANEINNSTGHINESINKLQNISLHVTNGIKEIDVAIKEMLISTQHISKVSIDSKERMEELNYILNSFDVLHVYTTIDTKRANMYFAEFTNDTKIQIESTRLSSSEMTLRLKEESKNPKVSIWFGGSLFEFISVKNSGLLSPYKPPKGKYIKKDSRDKDWYWFGGFRGVLGILCNTKYFEQNGIKYPETWQDLLNPEFRNKIAVSNPYIAGTAFTFLATLITLMGEDKAFEYWKKFDKNVHHYNKNGSKCVEEVGLGEDVVIGIAYYNDIMIKGINIGYPLKMIFPKEGTGHEVSCIGMIKNGPEPEFAKLFINWCLSKSGQEKIQKIYGFPIDPDVKIESNMINISEIKLVNYNFKWIGENNTRLKERWKNEIGR